MIRKYPQNKQIGTRVFHRIAIKTHMIMFGENILEIISKHAGSILQDNDIICISQKAISIAENSVVHISQVEGGLVI